MGNCIQKCSAENYSNSDLYSVDTGLYSSESSLSSVDTGFSQNTIRAPSVLSFKNGGKNENVYIDSEVCVVCLENYDDTQHNPVILPCGHMFCVICITTMAKKHKFKFIRCPVDRGKHELKNDRENSILENPAVALASTLSSFSSTQTNVGNVFQRPNLDISRNDDILLQRVLLQQFQSLESCYVRDWIYSTPTPSLSYTNGESLCETSQNYRYATELEPSPDYSPLSSYCNLTTGI